MAGETEINYSDFIGKDDTFDDIIKNLRDIQKELKATAKIAKSEFKLVSPNDSEQVNKLSKEVKELVQANKNLEKQIKILSKAKKERKKLTDEELIQAQKEKITQRERVQRAKQEAIIRKNGINSIKGLRAQLSKVSLDWSKLTEAEIKNSKAAKLLSKRKLDLTNRLKKLEKATGDNRRNVGNYTKSLSRLGKTAARVFIGRTLAQGLRRVGVAVADLIEKNRDADESIGKLGTAFDRLTKRGGGLGARLLSFLAPALTVITNGLANLLDFITGVDTSVVQFEATSENLKKTVDGLNKEFIKEVAAVDQVFTSLENANEGSKARKDIIDKINDQYGKYLPNLLTEKSTLEEIAQAQDLVNEAISKSFLLRVQQETQTDIFVNKATALSKSYNSIKESAEKTGVSVRFSLSDFQDFAEVLSKNAIVSNAFVKTVEGQVDTLGELRGTLNGAKKGLGDLAVSLGLIQKQGENVITPFNQLVKETFLYNKAIGETGESIKSLESDLKTYDRSTTKSTTTTNKNTKSIEDRIKAIEELQAALAKIEAENIKDSQQRALRLEQLRYEALQKQRKANFEELKVLLKGQEEELANVTKLNQRLSEEQLKEHENNKLDIRRKFAIKAIEIESLTEEDLKAQRAKRVDDSLKKVGSSSEKLAQQQKDIALENQKAIDDSLKKSQNKQAKSTKEMLQGVSSAAQQVSKIVTDLFQQQADLSQQSVSEQEENLSRARDRAAKGFESNIAFEEKELAARQSEQLKRQKEQEQAAKILTLFNLVSAYAQNGDKNALSRGLVDFALLEALGSGIQGFYEGTENVEESLGGSAKVFSGVDAYLGVTNSGKMLRFDGKERIFNAAQNMALGYMKNDEVVQNALIGQQISDYSNPFNPVNQNPYEDQKEAFKKVVSKTVVINDNQEVVSQLKNLNRRLAAQPNFSIEIEKMYKNFYSLIKTEVRQGMKRTTKKGRL